MRPLVAKRPFDVGELMHGSDLMVFACEGRTFPTPVRQIC